jgi:hypothetical protein
MADYKRIKPRIVPKGEPAKAVWNRKQRKVVKKSG